MLTRCVSAALAPLASSILASLSCSTMTHSGDELRGELDPLDGFLVGRVGAADEQAVAALAQHDDLVLRGKLGVDDVARQALRRRPRSGRAAAAPSAPDSVCARSDARDGARPRSRAATKLVRLLRGVWTSSSAVLRVELAGMDQHPRHAGERGLRSVGEGVHRRAGQPCKKRNDHRRSPGHCKRREHAGRARQQFTAGRGMRAATVRSACERRWSG